MVTHRVYLGEARHGEHVHPDAHEAVVDAVMFEAAGRVKPAVASPRTGQPNLLVGLARCAGCSYALKPQRQRSGDYRWSCRTLLSERSATHECPAPALIRQSEHQAFEQLVVDRAKVIVTDVGAETADDGELERAQRARVDAERLLDELATVEEREMLGPARWGKLVAQARARVDEAAAVEARAHGRERVDGRLWGTDAWERLDPAERQDALRTVVRAVMVQAGDGPLADRVHVLRQDNPVVLPRQGVPGVARTWVP